MTAISTQYSIVIIGIEGISARAEAVRPVLRGEVREIVARALASIRLRPEDIIETDFGDRCQLAIPPSVSPARLASTFVEAVDAQLAARASGRGPADSVRLRIALHCPAEGAASEQPASAIDLADALATAGSLQAVLKAATRAHLVLIVSAETYQLISRSDYRRIDTASFLPLRLDTGGPGEVVGWVTVPGYSSPPGIEPAARPVAGAGPDHRPVGRADVEPGSQVGVLVQGGYVGNLVGRDQIIHGDLIFGPRADRADDAGSGAR